MTLNRINRRAEKNNSYVLRVIFSFCSYCTLLIQETIHTFTFRMINERTKKKIRSFDTTVTKRFNEYVWFRVCVSKEITLSKWLLFFQSCYYLILNNSNFHDGIILCLIKTKYLLLMKNIRTVSYDLGICDYRTRIFIMQRVIKSQSLFYNH